VKIILISGGRKYCINFIISDVFWESYSWIPYLLNFPRPWISYVPHFLRNIKKVCEFKYESLRVVQICILPSNLNMMFFIYISLVLQTETAAACVFARLFIYIRLFHFLTKKAHQLLLLYIVDSFFIVLYNSDWHSIFWQKYDLWFFCLLNYFSFSLTVEVVNVLKFSRTHAQNLTDPLMHCSCVWLGM
jgi:hypothetical protein